MNFIKKVIDGKGDEFAHIQFQKFSKGEFRNRALIRVKKTKDQFTINTSSEFSNELVKKIAEKLGEKKTSITGAVVSTNDLTGELNFKEKKQFQGVKRYLIEDEMSGKEILRLLEKFPKTFFALTFESSDSKLKIKPKAPTSGKPGKGDESPKADFCKLVTTDKEWAQSFVFEKLEFKEAEIIHTFLIEELTFPKDEKDYSKIRELAKRKGKIIRHSKIDQVETTKEYKFES